MAQLACTVRGLQGVSRRAARTLSVSALRYLTVGDKASLTKTFTDSDVQTFAEVTGDHNPLHLDPEFAKLTMFGRPVVHGTLTLGLVSGLVASKLPGPGSVLLKQMIEYPAPLYTGEPVMVLVELVRYRRHIARLDLTCTGPGEKVVLRGSIDVLYERREQ